MYIFKQAKNAISNFECYPELLKTKISKVILYALFFIITFNFIFSAIPFATYYFKTKGFDDFIQQYVPDFNIENDKIIFEKYTKINTPLGITFIFDTKENNKITEQDKKDVENFIIKVTPTYVISSTLNLNIQLAPILKTFDIKNKQDLIKLKPIIEVSNIIAFLFLVLSFIFMDLFWLLIFSFFINSLASFYKLRFSMQGAFKLTVYVNTIPYILKFILTIIGIPMPSIIYLGIIIAYLHFIFKIILQETKEQQKILI